MALSAPTLLTEGFDNANRTTGNAYTTASISPTSGALVLAGVVTTGNNDDPTLTGAGLTWAKLFEIPYDTAGTPTDRLCVFQGTGTPSAGAITITIGANHTNCVWSF